MAGNTFGQAFRVSTFGESHGPAVGAIVEGCPPGLPLIEEDFQGPMSRRRPGGTPLGTSRKEPDRVEILSGVFEGLSTGAPIALSIRNHDVDSRPYEVLRELFRPGHADYTYYKRYGHFDFRGGGRSSARETAARVAAGVVAGKVLGSGVKVTAYTLELGGVSAERFELEEIDNNPFSCPDPGAAEKIQKAVTAAREAGDSLGGIVEVRVTGCPAGLGDPVFDKLDADLAKAVMSIGAVKGVEIGSGFEAARLRGSQNNDPITPSGFRTNHAGGILGGISNGDDILLRAAIKPVPSIRLEQDTTDRLGRPARLALSGRFDTTAVVRILPVLEAMVLIVLADHYLRLETVKQDRTQ